MVTWKFPKLRIFGLEASLRHQEIEDELPALLTTHARTLEEVHLHPGGGEMSVAVDWGKFSRLKKLHLGDLNTISHIIPALLGQSTSSYSSIPEPTQLEVYFRSALIKNQEIGAFNPAVCEYPQAFAQVVFHLHNLMWDEVLERLKRTSFHYKVSILSPLLDTASLTILDQDGQPLDSPAALGARRWVMQAEKGE